MPLSKLDSCFVSLALCRGTKQQLLASDQAGPQAQRVDLGEWAALRLGGLSWPVTTPAVSHFCLRALPTLSSWLEAWGHYTHDSLLNMGIHPPPHIHKATRVLWGIWPWWKYGGKPTRQMCLSELYWALGLITVVTIGDQSWGPFLLFLTRGPQSRDHMPGTPIICSSTVLRLEAIWQQAWRGDPLA